MESAGAKNRYTCEACRGHIVTVNRREGVTPFMLGCRATQGCKGLMQSACYRIDQGLPATFEWYVPEPAEARALDDEMMGHVLNGGLLLRPVTDPVVHIVAHAVGCGCPDKRRPSESRCMGLNCGRDECKHAVTSHDLWQAADGPAVPDGAARLGRCQIAGCQCNGVQPTRQAVVH